MKKTTLMLGLLVFIPFIENAKAQDGKALCTFLPVKEHFVAADYVPGVDVNGNAVVPANVKQQSDAFVDVIKVPVNIDLIETMGIDVAVPDGTEMQGTFGMVEVYKDSTVKYNGTVITEQAYVYCDKEPFDIHNASAEKLPEPKVKPEVKEKEVIIWSEE